MAIKSNNKISTEFSMSSMSDLVFLLLIFFMLTSTLVSPNAIKLLLPSSTSKTMAKQTITVYVNEQYQYFVNETPATLENLQMSMASALAGQSEATIVLRSDRTVPIQYIVNVIDAVNQLNEMMKTKYKVILATKPPEKTS
ncbi:MAG TPA: biopolymer transporter ExbD [Bacteroidales bacterium]|nr:biopolymer transporter ExbD [Bacteroidales bacterium]